MGDKSYITKVVSSNKTVWYVYSVTCAPALVFILLLPESALALYLIL